MKIDVVEPYTGWRANTPPGEHIFSVRIVRFPTLRSWLYARAYGWWALRVPCRLPGWHSRVEPFLIRHHAQRFGGFGTTDPHEGVWLRDRVLGWEVEQDFKANHLSHDVPTVLVSMRDITQQEWWNLRRRRKVADWEKQYEPS